jgi:hypothetical protein
MLVNVKWEQFYHNMVLLQILNASHELKIAFDDRSGRR